MRRLRSLVLLGLALSACGGDDFSATSAQPDASVGGSAGAGTGGTTSGGSGGQGATGGASGAAAGSGGNAADGGTGAGPQSQYVNAVLASDPVAYFRFEETSGEVFANEKGSVSGQLSVLADAEWAQPGAFSASKAFTFKSPATISLGDVFDFPGASPFTLELFVKVSKYPLNGYVNLITKHTSSENGWRTELNTTKGVGFALYKSGPILALFEASYLPAELTWTYLAFTRDGNNVCISRGLSGGAVDQKCQEKLNDLDTTVVPLRIGGGGFSGGVDELAIYTRALTLVELKAHMAAAVADGF